MAELIKKVGKIKGQVYGVLKTSFLPFPSYYGGRIILISNLWSPYDDCCGYYYNEAKAIENAKDILESVKKYYKLFNNEIRN